MKKLTFVCLLALLCVASRAVQGQINVDYNLPPIDINSPTHSTSLALEPSSEFKVAGVYWLPDYLEKNLDFNNKTQGGGEKPTISKDCTNMGYAIPSFVSDWSKYNYTEFSAANKVRCYKNFSCKSNFSKSSCPQWYQLAGNNCKDARGTFYERCDASPCAATYTAGVASCSPAAGYNYSSNGYSGTQICGKCTAKACASGSTSSSCSNGYTAQANGSYSGSSVCYGCVANACTGYGTKNEGSGWNCTNTCLSGTTTKYKCTAKACAEGSLTPNCDSVNYNTVNTTSYSGNSVCKKCEAKACPTSKDCTYGCKTWDTSRQSMCGKICNECIPCVAGGSATCSGQTTTCNSATQVQTSSCKDCSGTTHYSCRAKTCADGGYLSAVPANKKCANTISYAGNTCYSGCNYYYTDSKSTVAQQIQYENDGNSCKIVKLLKRCSCSKSLWYNNSSYCNLEVYNGYIIFSPNQGKENCEKEIDEVSDKYFALMAEKCREYEGQTILSAFTRIEFCFTGCSIGQIFYSDGTCSSCAVSGKTAIGVVVAPKKIMALNTSNAVWATGKAATTDVSCLSNKTSETVAIADMDGAANTKCLMNQGASNYPAANYCNNYKPVSSGLGSSGWYLPSAGELYAMTGYYDMIAYMVGKVGGTALGTFPSSSEYSDKTSWIVYRNGLMQYSYCRADGSCGKSVSFDVQCFHTF